MQVQDHSIEGQVIARSDTPAPGSEDEHRALLDMDAARAEEMKGYARRRTGWDARAGTGRGPMRSPGQVWVRG
jgi:hypothetical protein